MAKKLTKINYEFPVIIQKDEANYFVAICPSLQGCYTQGKTIEQAFKNIREVIELHVEDRLARGEKIPVFKPVSLTSLEVRV